MYFRKTMVIMSILLVVIVGSLYFCFTRFRSRRNEHTGHVRPRSPEYYCAYYPDSNEIGIRILYIPFSDGKNSMYSITLTDEKSEAWVLTRSKNGDPSEWFLQKFAQDGVESIPIHRLSEDEAAEVFGDDEGSDEDQ